MNTVARLLSPAVFKLVTDFTPAGDQPQAIAALVEGARAGLRDQVLLGVTGSGKTFTMAHTIQQLGLPTLIMAPNKTLAAQLYGEMKEFFPHNAVEYFVSYYDYYQPEAYVPKTDTFIEKEATINETIDRLRHAATRALLERRDVIIVASVSCLYGLGAPETYGAMTATLRRGDKIGRDELLKQLVALHYQRNDMAFPRGSFRARGDSVDIFPVHLDDRAWRVSLFGDEIEAMVEFDPLTGEDYGSMESLTLYAASHYITPGPTLQQAIAAMKRDLTTRLAELTAANKLLEAQRLAQRTTFDIEMLAASGMCAGIENYSRYLTGRATGEPPPTLFEYLPKDALLIVDESHVTVPQVRGMFQGDQARKRTLVDYGFRLPAALDNRPLSFEEWDKLRPTTVFVSATPSPWELQQTSGVFVEQLVRPTGLLDPVCIMRPTKNQVDDLIAECRTTIAAGMRVLVTTLTKKMAEALTDYLTEAGLRVRYMHADVETLDRIDILRDLRKGEFEVLVGINLLREGLDIPECGLVAILDADKPGYLRSETSLVQTIGRAARNIDGRVILYGDVMTPALERALAETSRRRAKQEQYNQRHNITPASIRKNISEVLSSVFERADHVTVPTTLFAETPSGKTENLETLRQKMFAAAAALNFEEAASLRDKVRALENKALELAASPIVTLAKSRNHRSGGKKK